MRRKLLLAIAIPVGAWVLAEVADRIAERRGESPATQLLRAPQQWRQGRGQS